MMSITIKESNKMFERGRKTHAERQQKCRRGARPDLNLILETLETLPEIQEELREQRRLLEIVTAAQAAEGAQQSEQGQH
jgi:hypothetical protein